MGSLYNLPQIYFISILFAALFIGEDFENRTISSFISAGHKRGDVFFAKALSYLTASTALLAVPVLFHSAAAVRFSFQGYRQNLCHPHGALFSDDLCP